jgi:hypothetical protein
MPQNRRMTGAATAQDFVFGRFVAQPGARRLLVDGEPAKLGAHAFDVLTALIEAQWLVTIAGAGGIGKTRLAQAAALGEAQAARLALGDWA